MNRVLLFLGCLFGVQAGIAQSKFANRVLEFLPAPGQFTNEKAYPAYAPGDDAATMASKATAIMRYNGTQGTGDNMSTISLGSWGGYIIVGFDHAILNKPYSYDFKVHGNWFDGNAESGIVMVSRDVNANGLADDPWYELAGSDYHHPATMRQYEVKYYRPAPLNGNVKWTDNRGNSGLVLRNSFHTQESYYPLWFSEDTLIFRGTRMASNAWNSAQPPQQYWRSESFAWGYADNQGNGSELSNFDIDWAVDVNGNPVNLEKIDFIKVYTGLLQDAGWLGETSTEFSQAEDLHPDYVFPPVFNSDVHIVKRLPVLSANSAWVSSGQASFTDDTVTFKASFESGQLKDGFTYSNQTTDASGAYQAASGGGTRGPGNSYLVGYFDKSAANNLNRLIQFNDGLPHVLEGVYVNNTKAVVQLLRNAGLRKGDQVKLVARGLDASGNPTGTRVNFLLADYSLANSVMHYIVEKWCWMDLSGLGSVSSIECLLEANRPEIVPNSFCLDQLVMGILPITQQPVGNPNGVPKICSGSSYTLTTATATSNASFQWYKDGVAINGATSATLPFAAVQAQHSGYYYCIIRSGQNQARTKTVPLLVNTSTRIVQNPSPASTEIPQATVINLQVIAEGDNLKYQWYKNNPAFPNNGYTLISQVTNATAIQPTLVPAPYGFVAANNGKYYVQVTGTCGVLRSDTVEYKVVANPNLPALAIISEPRDTTICYGNTVSFSVQATGATSYNWYKKNAAGGFGLVPNSQSTGFANPAISVYNQLTEGIYRVGVTQDQQTINSREARVTVVQNLAFTKPAAMPHLGSYQTVVNRPVSMEVSAPDFTPTAYQWYYKSNTDVDYITLSGQTSASYELPNASFADAGKYRCIVMGPAGSSVIEYTLTVVSLLRFQPVRNVYTINTGASGTQRPNGLFTPGENLFVSASVLLGLTNYTATWYKDGEEVMIPAANLDQPTHDGVSGGYWKKAGSNYAPWLLIKNVQPEHAGTYVLKITDATGLSELSTPVQIIINPEKPLITQEPVSVAINEDETFTLSVRADGKGFAPSYQWFHQGTALQGGTLSPYISSGPTKADLALVAKPKDLGEYYCVVTTPGGSDTSSIVTVSVRSKVKITSHPADQLLGEGGQASFTVTATGTSLTYQWMKNGLPVSGANGPTYTINQVTTTQEATYSCLVSDGLALPATSGGARLSVLQKPVITGNVLCAGEGETILRVQTQVKSTPPRYQWYKDGAPLAGATATWIKVTGITARDVSPHYSCKITNSQNGSLQSDETILVLGKAQIVSDLSKSGRATEGDVITLQLIAKGDGLRYQWFRNQEVINGANQSSHNFTAIVGESKYHCEVTNDCGMISSQAYTLTTLRQVPVITSQPQEQVVLKGALARFAVTATGSGLTYQWFKNGVTITGAASDAYTIPISSLSDSGSYHCVVSNTAASVTSLTVRLTVTLGAEFMVFPNPAQEYIWIKAELGKWILIYDLHGKKVHQQRAVNALEKVYVGGWMKGVYQVQMMGIGKEQTIQFIKL